MCSETFPSLASDDFDSATQLREQIQAYPIRFDLRQFQVKTCADVIEWSAKRLSERPQHLTNWLSAIRQELQMLTQNVPQPPSDFARNSKYQELFLICKKLLGLSSVFQEKY